LLAGPLAGWRAGVFIVNVEVKIFGIVGMDMRLRDLTVYGSSVSCNAADVWADLTKDGRYFCVT